MIRLLLILFHLELLSLSLSRGSIEYIITPDNVTRQESCHNCFTLQQFASHVSHQLDDNVTLTLQPGRHLLSVGLVVSNITTFIMQYYNSSQPDITLWCNQSGKLVFNSIQSVHIRNINLLECFGSKVIDVRNFTLLNTTFTGSYYVTSGSALEIIRSTALMYDCLFTKYYYGTYRWTTTSIPYNHFSVHRTKMWIGGALIITHSNVTIDEGNFTENRAQIGGAIYAENHSILTIINQNSYLIRQILLQTKLQLVVLFMW